MGKRKADDKISNEASPKKARVDTSALPSALSSTALSSSSTPATGKGKGRKKAEPKEKRQARFRGSCPNDISARLDRYLAQAQR